MKKQGNRRSLKVWASVLALLILVVWLIYAGFGGPSDEPEPKEQIILDESSRVG